MTDIGTGVNAEQPLLLGPLPPPPPPPGGPPPRSRHHHHVHTRTIVAGAVVFLAVGALIGALLAPSSITSAPSTTTTTRAASSSQSPGAPDNAGALAAAIAPALVDVNTIDSYQAVQGAGTGLVLTSNGIVLTNNHVVEGETSISVRDVGNGQTYDATVVGYDRSADVAVVRLTGASGLKTIGPGASKAVAVGDGVVAVGNAEGAGGTPSHAGGTVSALDQSIAAQDELSGGMEQLTGLLETNAAIVPGYSGGALVNTSAQVIGLVTAASASYQFGSNATAGYAIPIATARQVAGEIVAGQASSTVHIGATALLGVQVMNVFGGSGALITGVVVGGPADRAGLSAGDTITALNGAAVTSPDSLTGGLLSFKPGQTVNVQYLDPSGAQSRVDVTLASGPPQ